MNDLFRLQGTKHYVFYPLSNLKFFVALGDFYYWGSDSIACWMERDLFMHFPALQVSHSHLGWAKMVPPQSVMYAATSVSASLT